jgi:hypothetical protein
MPLRQVIEEEDQKAANDNALDEWFSWEAGEEQALY